jgi:hypothetical protein
MSEQNEPGISPPGETGDASADGSNKRERLSPVPLDERGRIDPSRMNPNQAALRQAVVDSFNAKKARTFLQKQVNHINASRELANGIKFLFDEHGRAPANAPLEDIIEERRKVEYHLMWLESLTIEMRHRLVKIREVEDAALEVLARANPDE